MPLLELKNIFKIYKSGTEELFALNNVNLTVQKGDFLSIAGQSGSGKSTLMNILGCLDIPTRGDFLFEEIAVSRMPKKKLARIRNEKIGFVFQSFNLIPTLSAIENAELPLLYRRMSKANRRKAAEEALIKVGLEKRMHHKPSQLSGGQQQRVAVARALAANPEIILADEPTGNLDSTSGKEVISLLEALNNEGKTLIIITHDNNLAMRAKRVSKISDGILTFTK